MKNYKYKIFSSNTYNLDKFSGPEAGSKASDFLLSTLDDTTVQLFMIYR